MGDDFNCGSKCNQLWREAFVNLSHHFTSFDLDPTTRHTWFSLVIGGGFTYLSLYAVNQTQVQRLLTVKSLKQSQKAMFINWPILSFLSFSTGFSGLALYYYYGKCDPVLTGRIASRDQIMPLFVVDAMGDMPGLPGIFVSGIFSASLSTISAAMNSLAAVTLEDYIKVHASACGNDVPLNCKCSSSRCTSTSRRSRCSNRILLHHPRS